MLSVTASRAILLFLASSSVAAGPENSLDTPQATDASFRAQNEALQAQLQWHRELVTDGGWSQVPEGPVLRPQAMDPRLADLAARLAASGDLPDSAAWQANYDKSLEYAVRRFQGRHGLAVDGVVGRATLQAINTPAERRIEQIRVNLERMRAMTDTEEADFILVNVPAFKATLVRDNRSVWATKVIVGQTGDETPELRSELQSVVFNPTWSVPHSIASEELLLDIKSDPGFFTDGGYQLYDREGGKVDPASVDWHGYSSRNFPFRLLQLPGPRNQLGKIKFIVPNPFSICMHDTPARSLFASTKRALSHGCIRMDEPLMLAELVLAAEGWTRERIDAQIRSGKTKKVLLSNPLPVYVVYWTAFVDESGKVQFRNDIYGRDAEILDALNGN